MSHPTVPEKSPIPPHVPAALVHDFDLYNVEVVDGDYHASMKRLQATGMPDIFWTPRNGGHWVAARGEDIYEIFKDHERFSSRQLVVPRHRNPTTPLPPISLDPPEQAKYRSLFAPALSPKAVSPLGEGARALAIELIEGFHAKGECEFVGEFAQHLPIGIFMRLVDVPAGDRDQLLEWADQQVRPTSEEAHDRAFQQLFAYAAKKVAERKANPGSDLISQLTKAQIDGKPITVEQLTPMIFLLLVGGLDTVASAMGFAARFLATSPAHRRELIDHPDRIPNAVEELLRRFPVVNAGRVVVRDMDYKGVAMRAGDQIIMPTSLHGVDDRKFDDPLKVDFSRPTPIHSTFGNGAHRCPGSLLARTELRIFLEEWLKRIPDFRIKPGTTPGVRAGVNATLYSLNLVWDVK
ncbi:cytochrome P450 [Piscinibacter sp. XHJ-5]|uniref:cytochrome P450 n=1 Tax=Piscinibacter sp. XHJ-5 TaxID=3037797 RepID=UPI002452C036|nr:cytochrome P450 [Piscinibacter sp. XHJ-5]